MLRRRSISSSGTAVPDAASLPRSPRSICQVLRMAGSSGCTSSKRAKWSGVSRMTAMAPESTRFHFTCAGELVS